MRLISVMTAFAYVALSGAAFATEPASTKATAIFENTNFKSLSVDRNGEVTDIEYDSNAKGLGITAWVPPRLIDNADAELAKVREKVLRKLNAYRASAGVQIIKNPHSQ